MDPIRRAEGTRDDLADTHPGDATSEDLAVDRVAIPHEPARRRVIREGLDDLLGRPRSRGMLRDPQMDNPPTVMGQQHEHEQHATCERWHREKSIETSDVR